MCRGTLSYLAYSYLVCPLIASQIENLNIGWKHIFDPKMLSNIRNRTVNYNQPKTWLAAPHQSQSGKPTKSFKSVSRNLLNGLKHILDLKMISNVRKHRLNIKPKTFLHPILCWSTRSRHIFDPKKSQMWENAASIIINLAAPHLSWPCLACPSLPCPPKYTKHYWSLPSHHLMKGKIHIPGDTTNISSRNLFQDLSEIIRSMHF